MNEPEANPGLQRALLLVAREADMIELSTQLATVLQALDGREHDDDPAWDAAEAEERADLERAKRHLLELETTIDRGKLDAVTAVSYDIFAENQRRAIAAYEWRYHRYLVDQMNGLQSRLPAFLINTHRVETVADAEAYVQRLTGVARQFDEAIAWLGECERRGVLPPKS